MFHRVFRGVVGVFAVGAAVLAFGQSQVGKTLQPTSVQVVEASNIDTRDFVVRIDESFNYQPLWPENPVFRDGTNSKPNDLPVGKLLKDPRGILGAYFPAISATGWTPPDPDLAVGTNHILATVNSSIAFFDKQGVKQFQQTAQDFFAGMGAGSFLFDPKCFYDRVNQRYVLIFLEQDDPSQTSKILLAVSDDNDPNGTWHRYRLEAKLTVNNVAYWLDYPGFGYNKDAYVVCGNMFGFTSGFAGVQFLVVPSAPALTGSPVTVSSIRDANMGSAQVAEMISATEPMVYAAARNGSTGMRIYSVNNPGGAPTVQFTNVTVPSNSGPTMEAASTNNRTLDTIDSRIYNVTWRNGSLVTAHNVQVGSFVGSRWYQINTNGYPAGTPTLNQSGNISSGTQHYFVPALSLNSLGSIGAIFTGSSTSIAANLNFAGRLAGDAPGLMGAPQLLEASSGNNYSQGRWGDYFGVDVDPTDDYTFWGIGMTIALRPPPATTDTWQTSIYSWRVGPPPTALQKFTLNPTQVLGGGTCTGTVLLTNPAPFGGIAVSVTSSSTFASVPPTVTVPAGSKTASFTVNTTAPTNSLKVIITPSFNGVSRPVAFVLLAPPPANPTITYLAIIPNSVLGGNTTTGRVTLTGPALAGGVTVSLSSNNSFVTVPPSVTVPQGATTADFVVSSTLPPSEQLATISATHDTTTKTAFCQVRIN